MYEDDSDDHGTEVPRPVFEKLPCVRDAGEEEEYTGEERECEGGCIAIDDDCCVARFVRRRPVGIDIPARRHC